MPGPDNEVIYNVFPDMEIDIGSGVTVQNLGTVPYSNLIAVTEQQLQRGVLIQ